MFDIKQALSRRREATPAAPLPANVHADLVDALYPSLGSLVIGGATSSMTSWFSALRTGDAGLMACAVGIVLVSLARVAGTFLYRRRTGGRPPQPGSVARAWETAFTVGAWAIAGLLGLLCSRAILATDDAVAHLLTASMAIGFAGGATGRNASRPVIACGQLALTMLPLAVASILRAEPAYFIYAATSILYCLALLELMAYLHRTNVGLLLTMQGKAELASELEQRNAALQRREEELSAQHLRFDAALNNMSQGLCMFDAEQRLVVCNGRYLELFGMSPEVVQPGVAYREVVEHSAAQGNHSDEVQIEAVLAAKAALVAEGRTHDYRIDLSSGRTVAVSHRPMPDGWVATYEDITERSRAEARIEHMARHDALTGLANRTLFRERLEAALIAHRSGNAEPPAVLLLDLDEFKAVNDTLGHPAGDALLIKVAERLREATRDTDVVSRLGGDEFAILRINRSTPRETGALAQRIIDLVGAPFELEQQHQVVIGVSVGIAAARAGEASPDDLLKSADMALYRAKGDGRGVHRFFEPEMNHRLQTRRALEIDLRGALAGGQFELHYQPLIDLSSNEVGGCEALLRWHHPERGTVQPADFIPLAEETGLIVPIGEWVVRHACADAAAWPSSVGVAVNISPAQFRSRRLESVVMGALAASGLPASRLELEITETVLMQDSEATLQTLRRLRAIGVRIALDDFGTGYSSLSYLRKFPFDKIKIDRSFVRDLHDEPDCAAIVAVVADLGRKLGVETTAEGVETEAQLSRVRAKGCTHAQGYLFSRPVPVSEIRRAFASHDRAKASAA